MDCGQCQGIEREFNQKEAARQLRSYRENGPADTTQILIEALKSQGVQGRSLMDIGGGVGTIQHELLKAGASQTMGVEASSAYAETADREGRRQGHRDRMVIHHGNFVDLASTLPTVDIVTLDRVVCCYHDMRALVDLSSSRARGLYGLVFPRDGLLMRAFSWMANLYLWLRRNPFRIFVHPTRVIEAILNRNGFHQVFYQKNTFWQIAVYGR